VCSSDLSNDRRYPSWLFVEFSSCVGRRKPLRELISFAVEKPFVLCSHRVGVRVRHRLLGGRADDRAQPRFRRGSIAIPFFPSLDRPSGVMRGPQQVGAAQLFLPGKASK
jgi:hypothetical protein